MKRIVIFWVSVSFFAALDASFSWILAAFSTAFFVSAFVFGAFLTGGDFFTFALNSLLSWNGEADSAITSAILSVSSSSKDISKASMSISSISSEGIDGDTDETTFSISSSSSLPVFNFSFRFSMILSLYAACSDSSFLCDSFILSI